MCECVAFKVIGQAVYGIGATAGVRLGLPMNEKVGDIWFRAQLCNQATDRSCRIFGYL